jgi:hypothetical protein
LPAKAESDDIWADRAWIREEGDAASADPSEMRNHRTELRNHSAETRDHGTEKKNHCTGTRINCAAMRNDCLATRKERFEAGVAQRQRSVETLHWKS